MKDDTPQLVLASTSPYRRELLQRLGIAFAQRSPDVDETPLPGEAPEALVLRLAIAKARTVAAHCTTSSLVIGSDQIALHGEKIVGKPADHADAVAQLRAASGKAVRLLTAVALINTRSGRVQHDIVPYTVNFRELDDATIHAYIEREQPWGCAGSLKAEGLGMALLQRHDGCDPSALIGLPMLRLLAMLREEAWDPLFVTTLAPVDNG